MLNDVAGSLLSQRVIVADSLCTASTWEKSDRLRVVDGAEMNQRRRRVGRLPFLQTEVVPCGARRGERFPGSASSGWTRAIAAFRSRRCSGRRRPTHSAGSPERVESSVSSASVRITGPGPSRGSVRF